MMNSKQGELKKEQREDRADICISDSTEMNLLGVSEATWKKLGRAWSKPTARMSDSGGTYRFVNYLDQSGLLKDNRAESGVGWRAFSYVDCIYLELVLALRKMGVKADTLRYLYRTFSQSYSDERATYTGIDWLDVLICVHSGTEMEIIINSEDGKPKIADPAFMTWVGEGATDGQIRVSLSVMVNNIRKRNDMSPIKIKHSIGSLSLTDAEFDAVFSIKNLKNEEEEIHIRRTTKNRVLVDKKKIEPSDSPLAKDIQKVMDKYGIVDFTDMAFAIRQGGIANTRVKTSNIFDK